MRVTTTMTTRRLVSGGSTRGTQGSPEKETSESPRAGKGRLTVNSVCQLLDPGRFEQENFIKHSRSAVPVVRALAALQPWCRPWIQELPDLASIQAVFPSTAEL